MKWFLRRVLFIALPVVEILLIFWVAREIGWLWTILLLFAGFAVGIWLLRIAGRSAFALLRRRAGAPERFVTIDEVTGKPTTIYQPGRQPGDPPPGPPDPEQLREDAVVVREAGLLVTAAVLFMVPGFITDVTGAVLALPPVRAALARRERTPRAKPGFVVQGEIVVVDDQGVHAAHWDNRASESAISPGDVISGDVISGEGSRAKPSDQSE